MSAFGTFRTCRGSLTMSVDEGRPEAAADRQTDANDPERKSGKSDPLRLLRGRALPRAYTTRRATERPKPPRTRQVRIRKVDTEAELSDIEDEIDGILKAERAKSAAGDESAVDDATLTVAAHRLERLIHDRRTLIAKRPAVAPAA